MLDDDLFFYFLWSFLLEYFDLQIYKTIAVAVVIA